MILGRSGDIRVNLPEPMSVPDGRGGATTLPPGMLLPGNEITCRVEVTRVDDKARSAVVSLGYKNTFELEETRENPHPEPGESRYETRRTVDSEWILVSGARVSDGPPRPGVFTVRLTVPTSGPPTVNGRVEWRLQAVIERHHGFDAKDVHDIHVPAVAGMYERLTPGGPRLAEKVPLHIETTGSRHLVRGTVVHGRVTGHPTASVTTRGIRIQLVRHRTEKSGIHHRDVELDVPLCGGFTTWPGRPFQLPFTIQLPTNPSPTFHATNNSQTWALEAVADIPFDIDRISSLPVTLV